MRSAAEMFMRERIEKEGRFGTEDVKQIIIRFAQFYMTGFAAQFRDADVPRTYSFAMLGVFILPVSFPCAGGSGALFAWASPGQYRAATAGVFVVRQVTHQSICELLEAYCR